MFTSLCVHDIHVASYVYCICFCLHINVASYVYMFFNIYNLIYIYIQLYTCMCIYDKHYIYIYGILVFPFQNPGTLGAGRPSSKNTSPIWNAEPMPRPGSRGCQPKRSFSAVVDADSYSRFDKGPLLDCEQSRVPGIFVGHLKMSVYIRPCSWNTQPFWVVCYERKKLIQPNPELMILRKPSVNFMFFLGKFEGPSENGRFFPIHPRKLTNVP